VCTAINDFDREDVEEDREIKERDWSLWRDGVSPQKNWVWCAAYFPKALPYLLPKSVYDLIFKSLSHLPYN